MRQVLHGSAATTEAVRRAMQRSQESLIWLAKRHGINPKMAASNLSAICETLKQPGRSVTSMRQASTWAISAKTC